MSRPESVSPEWLLALAEAAEGDLRPQFNAGALLNRRDVPADPAAFEAVLRQRFFELARPIADASQGDAADMRLGDAGRFFYLIESLQRLGYPAIEETLLIILDEFLQMEPSAYNELYLWSLVQLSRCDRRHVENFWPMVIALDQRYRATPWQRPAGSKIVDRPYHFTELLFHFYTLYTLHNDSSAAPSPNISVHKKYASLGFCLTWIGPRFSPAQLDFVGEVLVELQRHEGRAAYSDAHGLIESIRREQYVPFQAP